MYMPKHTKDKAINCYDRVLSDHKKCLVPKKLPPVEEIFIMGESQKASRTTKATKAKTSKPTKATKASQRRK